MKDETEGMQVRWFCASPDDPAFAVKAICIESGSDLVVVVGGGERYHIGALALSLSMPGLKEPHKPTNSTYVIPVPGHKEELLAREGALQLSRTLQKNVSINVGIHRDNLKKEDIQQFSRAFNRLIETIIDTYLPGIDTSEAKN